MKLSKYIKSMTKLPYYFLFFDFNGFSIFVQCSITCHCGSKHYKTKVAPLLIKGFPLVPKSSEEGLRIGKTHGHNESKVCSTRWPCHIGRHTHIVYQWILMGKWHISYSQKIKYFMWVIDVKLFDFFICTGWNIYVKMFSFKSRVQILTLHLSKSES